MSNKERVLVVAPHFDDEAFGCLGTLLKHKAAGDALAFLYLTDGHTARITAQRKGAFALAKYFKATPYLTGLADQALDIYPLTTVIVAVESSLETFTPTIVYMPFIGDLNRDHRLVSEATMVACRPYKANAPKEVWMYSIPGTTELGFSKFHKDRTERIDADLKYKLIKKWYPNELINGRDDFHMLLEEHFQRWPGGF